jgi:MoaA/NifB/PqqE/SkfB family radical SAM enzyme
MSRYRVIALVELTGACQAHCSFCERDPRASAARPMTERTFDTVLRRLRPRDVSHAELAGFGEPLLHPSIDALLLRIPGHPVPFRLCTNGELLDAARQKALDGVVERVVVVLASSDAAVAGRIQPGLDHERVLANLRTATRLRKTVLEVAVPNHPDCLSTLECTLAYLRALGVRRVSVSARVHVHGGAVELSSSPIATTRAVMQRLGLHDSEADRVPPVTEVLEQWRAARCRCVPRNASLLIDTAGRYHDCFHDAAHGHVLGHVDLMTVREALGERERRDAPQSLCAACSLRDGFGPDDLAQALANRGADATRGG